MENGIGMELYRSFNLFIVQSCLFCSLDMLDVEHACTVHTACASSFAEHAAMPLFQASIAAQQRN